MTTHDIDPTWALAWILAAMLVVPAAAALIAWSVA